MNKASVVLRNKKERKHVCPTSVVYTTIEPLNVPVNEKPEGATQAEVDMWLKIFSGKQKVDSVS